jgi:YidC/Oxa1 family membrane protein insertase
MEKNPDMFTYLIGMGQKLFQDKLFAEAAVCYEHAIPMVCFNLRCSLDL